MIKFLLKIIKRVIMSFVVLYGLNVITSSIGLVLPINIISISILTLLGLPGLCGLTALYFLI